MRKITLVLACIILGFAVQAQETTEPTNVVKVNPLGLLFGTASVSYEKAISDKSSFVIAPTFGGFKFGGVKYSSFGAGAEYRFYLSKTKVAPSGFYAGPGAGFTSGKVTVDNGTENKDKVKFSSVGLRGFVGNQWIFKSGFTLDLNGGLSYQKFNYKGGDGEFSTLKGGGILPSLGFSLGYAF